MDKNISETPIIITEETYLEIKKYIEKYENNSLNNNIINIKEQPYLENITVEINVKNKYNPNYGDDRICECGHSYYRHFDSYEYMEAVGCKYCDCYEFKERK